MSTAKRITQVLPAVAVAATLLGCEEPKKEPTKPKASAPAAAPAAPTVAPAPKPAVKKPSHPCPDGSQGDGTFNEPCKANGTARIMEVTWNGKIGDKGPTFKVINKADLEILYGRIVVYFYDKKGNQLEAGAEDKKKKRLSCSGNIFAGPMKAGEKAFLNFSCVKKDYVPDDATAIEAEMQMVGFTAASGGKPDTYWRNDDLVPEKRPKGGVKGKKK